jgi:hypothetical protein
VSEKLLQDSELKDIVVRPYKLKKLEHAINEVKLSGISTSFKAMGRMLWLYFTKLAYMEAMNYMARDAMTMPRNYMKYYGYGIYAGKKPL